MPFTAEQHNFYDDPARLFYMDASMCFVPVQVLHRYVGHSAACGRRLPRWFPWSTCRAEMTQAETVTLFNDMCIMALGTLVDPAIAWETVDAQIARATFTNEGHTIRAELSFNETGELMNFWSMTAGESRLTAR
jgi:hypothetical protein